LGKLEGRKLYEGNALEMELVGSQGCSQNSE
jgi:hypothetical protein